METLVGCTFQLTRVEREYVGGHIIVGPFGVLRRDSDAPVGLIQITRSADKFKILPVGSVVGAAGPR
jgi:hypothetical protein